MSARLGPGTVIDGFRIDDELHSGGLGVIYGVTRVAGQGPDDGIPLLMKVPRLGPGEAGENVVTYEVERMVLSALRGRHVPRFVAAGDIAAQPYLVMEQVLGRPLGEVEGRQPPAEVARIGAAVADALDDIHSQGALHLDVKQSNVILRENGEAVLIDFGLSHHLHYPDLLAEEVRRPIGSAPYISPEQVLGVRGDPRRDLVGLGARLYELCTGQLPFGAPSSMAGLRQRLWIDPTPPRALVPGLPEWLQEVILGCLEPDPRERYATASQVALDLRSPEQLVITERGRRLRTAGAGRRFMRWMRAGGYGSEHGQAGPAPLPQAPIVMVAVATHHTNEQRNQALRAEVSARVRPGSGTRLACVAVIRPAAEMGEGDVAGAPTSQRIKHLVLLRHWAESLALPPEQLSFHVMEATDPVDALLDYASRNHVDHLVIGAPPRDVTLGGLLGTVATRVANEAPCTVTLVRSRT
jgi:nucleotide-binding universal stress UspA family protein